MRTTAMRLAVFEYDLVCEKLSSISYKMEVCVSVCVCVICGLLSDLKCGACDKACLYADVYCPLVYGGLYFGSNPIASVTLFQ